MVRRLLLTKPQVKYPVKKQGYAGDVGISLGLLYLAAHAREFTDVDVSLKDYRLQAALGAPRNLEADLQDANIVGVGACTAEAPDALEILKKAKEMGKTTVMGGLFPTFNAEEVLQTGYVDYVVNGEGEVGISNLLRALDGKINIRDVKGIVYRENGEIVRNPGQELITDLDSLPMPAYDLVSMEEYAKLSPAALYAARGCPLSCKFCTLNELWEFRYRKRSFDNVIEELEILRDFRFERVHFKDETITLNRKWCMELFREIEQAGLGMKYKVKSRIDGLDEPLLIQMMAAGVDTIHSGIESVSQRSLDNMEKRIDVNNIRRSFDLMLSNGCNVNPVYMFSYPGETVEDLRENADFIEEIGQREGVITYVSFITPHPGSAFAHELSSELDILSTDYSRYTHKQPVAVPKSLGPEGLERMVDYYHRIADATGMQDVNPRVDGSCLEEVRSKKLVEVLV